jgi:hypothetical protein
MAAVKKKKALDKVAPVAGTQQTLSNQFFI